MITPGKLFRTGFAFASEWGLLNFIPDKLFLKIYYRIYMGRRLNLENPQTYTEKLQWLKLYDRNPVYTDLCDKYKVRSYVAEKIGDSHLIPLIAVWDKPDEIDFSRLPDSFVLKCNHDSGGVVIVKNKRDLNEGQVRRLLKTHLKENFFWKGREWPYKNIQKKIVAEQFMVDESGYELKDYKFFCFNGKCKAVFIATDRGTDTRFDFYDTDFRHLNIINGHPMADKKIEKPEKFEEMIILAERLSEGFPQVRVDLYNINGEIYFGEMTFFHWGGKIPFEPEEWDYTFGNWIDISQIPLKAGK